MYKVMDYKGYEIYTDGKIFGLGPNDYKDPVYSLKILKDCIDCWEAFDDE